MLGSDDANLLVNAAHRDEEEGGGDATVAVGNHNRKANNVLDTPWYVHCTFVLCSGYNILIVRSWAVNLNSRSFLL